MKRRIFFRFFLSGFFLVMLGFIALLTLEIYFRSTKKYPTTGQAYNKDEIWRWSAKRVDHDTDDSGEAFTLRINSEGFRGEEPSYKKPDDEIRILVLGDSYTAAFYLPDEKTFGGLLEKGLEPFTPTGKKIRVINRGVPGWGADQEYIYLKTEAIKYHPDYVLLMAVPNDLREAYCKKLVELQPDGILKVNKPNFKEREIIYWKLSNVSSFFQYLQTKYRKEKLFGTFDNLMEHYRFNFGKDDDKDWDRPVFLKTAFPELLQARKLYKVLLNQMNDICQQNQAKFIVTAIPTLIEFNDFMKDDTLVKPGLFNSEVRSISDSSHMDFIDLYDPFTTHPDPVKLFRTVDFHLGIEGDQVVADNLISYFKSELTKDKK